MMTYEQAADFNQKRGKAFVCKTCAIQKMGLCNDGPINFCDLTDYVPTLDFIDFVMTSLTKDGSSDEAKSE